MIQIWCPSPHHHKCACARICSKLKAKRVYLLLIRQASSASTSTSGVLLVSGSTLVIIGDNGPTAGNTTPPRQRCQRHSNTTSLQSKTARPQYKRRWRAPCSIWSNANVLNLSKGIFKNLVKIREPSVEFCRITAKIVF